MTYDKSFSGKNYDGFVEKFYGTKRERIVLITMDVRDGIGYEFRARDVPVLFDNRGKGHDNTITSDKTQATVMDSEGAEAIPKIGLADKKGNVLLMPELPY